MPIKFKVGDRVRLKGQTEPKTVRGENDAGEVVCDWDDAQNKPQQASYPEAMLEDIPDVGQSGKTILERYWTADAGGQKQLGSSLHNMPRFWPEFSRR